ncbi:MAG: hypothetical protein R3174_06975 [Gammaproteobacteria bacterium]|nr:hypothetical protein [Gammaproteobacteria bacterium]
MTNSRTVTRQEVPGRGPRILAVALVAGAIAVGGCVPTVSRPPPAHAEGGVDPRLLGTWLSGDEDPGFTFVGSGDDGRMRAALTKVLDNGRLEVTEFELYRSESRAGDLLMVREDGKENARRYLPVRYRFENEDRFQIAWLLTNRVKGAIERGELEGRVEEKLVDEVIISAPHGVVDDWIRSTADAWDMKHAIWFERIDERRLGCSLKNERCPK